MGKNKIDQFLSGATKNLPLYTSSKFTSHFVRKTCIKTLLDSGVSHNNVAQLSGHNSLESLDSYDVVSPWTATADVKNTQWERKHLHVQTEAKCTEGKFPGSFK